MNFISTTMQIRVSTQNHFSALLLLEMALKVSNVVCHKNNNGCFSQELLVADQLKLFCKVEKFQRNDSLYYPGI